MRYKKKADSVVEPALNCMARYSYSKTRSGFVRLEISLPVYTTIVNSKRFPRVPPDSTLSRNFLTDLNEYFVNDIPPSWWAGDLKCFPAVQHTTRKALDQVQP